MINKEYSEYIAETVGNGISGSCGVSGVSGVSGTCGKTGTCGNNNKFLETYANLHSESKESSKLPILKDLELIPINKKAIKIQINNLYGTLGDNSNMHMLYE